MDHEHTLQLNGSGALPYMCSGCKDLGFGSSYNCINTNCDYILHKECAEPIIHVFHPFFNNCTFRFYDKVLEEGGFCDACGKDVLGFFYHCSQTGCSLHPCCLKLPDKIFGKDGNVIMTLCNEVPSNCAHCNQRNVVRNQFKGWSYVNSDGKSCVHVSCFKEMSLDNLNNREETTTRSNGQSFAFSFCKFTGRIVVEVLFRMVKQKFLP